MTSDYNHSATAHGTPHWHCDHGACLGEDCLPCELQERIDTLETKLATIEGYHPANAEECPACDSEEDICIYHRGFSAGMFIAGEVLHGLIQNDFQALDYKGLEEALREMAKAKAQP